MTPLAIICSRSSASTPGSLWARAKSASAHAVCIATSILHRDFYLEFAESICPSLRGPDQGRGFRLLEREHDNLRAAIETCRQRPGESDKELRLVVALGRFWDTRGYLREGRAHLAAAIDRMPADLPLPLQAAALGLLGWVAYVQADSAAARHHYARALAIQQANGDLVSVAQTLNPLALAGIQEGRLQEARSLLEQALAILRSSGPTGRLGSVLQNLGGVAIRLGQLCAARRYLEESAAWCASVGDQQLHGLALCDLSSVDLCEGRCEDAETRARQGLEMLRASGALVDVPDGLEQMALVAAARSDWIRATRLQGAAEHLRAAAGAAAPSLNPALRTKAADATRRALRPEAYASAYRSGYALSMEQALDYALSGSSGQRAAP